jgi:hypothetical protein
VSQKITDEINRATVKEGELEEAIEEVEDAVTLLNSSDTTSGSVAYAVKQEATARYEEDEDIRDNLQTKQSNLTSEQLDTVNGDRFSAGNYSTTAEMNAAIQQAIYAAE